MTETSTAPELDPTAKRTTHAPAAEVTRPRYDRAKAQPPTLTRPQVWVLDCADWPTIQIHADETSARTAGEAYAHSRRAGITGLDWRPVEPPAVDDLEGILGLWGTVDGRELPLGVLAFPLPVLRVERAEAGAAA
jgi:hypothetical protein